jgi:squalene synthase HpnC
LQYLLPEAFVRSKEALSSTWTEHEALSYTRWLATSHYENFHVVSFLLPKDLHQDFYNVYSFCRWADDLGDEIGNTNESQRLLAWWQELLDEMYLSGRAQHPVFVALRGTAERRRLPKQPFSDLIKAFVHDQTVTRYPTWEDLFYYCRHSANPVGRLVLYLCGYDDSERQALSDATCTALQLANFWQDISVDLRKDRIYIPLEVMERHGYTPDDLFAGRENEQFQQVIEEVVGKARALFIEGLPLCGMVNRRLSLDLNLFSRGGMRVLDKIEQQRYRVLHHRPAIGKVERVGILLGSLARVMLQPGAA